MLSEQGFAIGGQGEIVDWLVVMNRLDESQMLDNVIRERRLHRWQLDRLVEILLQFYRRAKPVSIAPAAHLAELWRGLAYNRRVLLDPRLGIPSGSVHHIDAIQRRFVKSEQAIWPSACEDGGSSMDMETCVRNIFTSAIRFALSTA